MADDLTLKAQVKAGVELFHTLADQRGQPRVVSGARHLQTDRALIINNVLRDQIQLMAKFAHIGDVQGNGGERLAAPGS